MASYNDILESSETYFENLPQLWPQDTCRHRRRYLAAVVIQKYARGYVIRKYIARLHCKAIVIQRAFRGHVRLYVYRKQLKWFVTQLFKKHFNDAATTIQCVWRGYLSRRLNFCYRSYRRWLRTVTERGERKVAENAEFRKRTRVECLQILEDEARQWLAFVIFKLHHLLRTYVSAGIYSNPYSTQLTEFEKLISAVRYTEYMKRLTCKYEEFVRKHKTAFNNKILFPIIGYGEDYWYLTLPEMLSLTAPVPKEKRNTRHSALHHGPIHKRPFLWCKPRTEIPRDFLNRGPFALKELPAEKLLGKSKTYKSGHTNPPPPTLASTKTDLGGGDNNAALHSDDPRFHLYVTHYKPIPDVFKYIDFHINAILLRKHSIEHMHC